MKDGIGYYIGVDLGTTNLKAALYDENMALVARKSRQAAYSRDGGFVELDAQAYFDALVSMLGSLLEGRGAQPVHLALTGQAETLVVLGADGAPLMNAISWMDERSAQESAQIAGRFDPETYRAVTGQLAVLPTWPATKILWLRRHRPKVFKAAARYALLKDYIVYRLTGRWLADCSIATFSSYFDIYERRYWREMLDYIGVREAQLPPLAEPCTDAGAMLPEVAQRLGLKAGARVNIGTLDHFAGMIGTGNLRPGTLTLSTGTVMALAAMSAEPAPRTGRVAMHYGFLPGTHVMLPVAESGGVSLEWFRNACMPSAGYDRINEVLSGRGPNSLIFLPYIVGVNAPDFDAGSVGVFWGLRREHDAFDMARAVMEGVAFLLRQNCESLAAAGAPLDRILATGGGSKSPVWCQIQADVTGLPICVPREREAACLGAAMIAAVSAGRFESLESAARACVQVERRFDPAPDPALEEKYRRFRRLCEVTRSPAL